MPARPSLSSRRVPLVPASGTRFILFGLLALGVAVVAGATLFAQADALGAPRWMPQERMPGPRTADAVAMERTLLAFVERVKQLPVLTPPPGVYPEATLTFEAAEAGLPHRGIVMLGFWPPDMTKVTNGKLRSAGELSHLVVNVNFVRTEAFDRTYWKDALGPLLPQPRVVGEVQGFPVYEGFGGIEVSGILVVQPAGRQLFVPVTRARFHDFEVSDLERQLQAAQPALKTAQEKLAALTSAEGRAAQEKRIADSLAQYEKTRPRTPDQMRSREQDIRRLEAEEEARLKADATPEGNRLTGPLHERLTRANAARAALSPAAQAEQACHAPDSRVMGPHPVAPGTAGCQPVVSVARWYAPALPRSAPQLISVERYWSSAEAARRGVDRARSSYLYVNTDVVESLDWRTIAADVLK